MPEYLAPGVYVEEIGQRARTIARVPMSTCVFVGPVRSGAATMAAPPLLASVADFETLYGGAGDLAFADRTTPDYLAHAVRAFFAEGGRALHVLPLALAPGDDGRLPIPQPVDYADALARLDTVPDARVVAVPGASAWCEDAGALLQTVVSATGRSGRFVVLDPPPGLDVPALRTLRQCVDATHAALYAPWVAVAGPDGPPQRLLPPSGFVCGVYARTDLARGVHKPPANEVLHSATGLERAINRHEQQVLNPEGINCLRTFEGRGHRVWGARTLSADPEWKYVSARRHVDCLEASIVRGLAWVAFEANDERLWREVVARVSDFLHAEWRAGALQGDRPDRAYFVRCDAASMTRVDIDHGRLVCLVGVALQRPAEFTMLRIRMQAATAA